MMVVLYAGCHGELRKHASEHSVRTLKIKQCKTRTKTHKYPLILTQYEKNPAMRNYCHTDANERQ